MATAIPDHWELREEFAVGSSQSEALPEALPETVPQNPGSKRHPHDCKPCNKYNPSRAEPNDSCKHGDKCEFCHAPHERQKHRGQRGRHALQRRQFLENRGEMAKPLQDLIERIYKEPHQAVDDLKTRLGSPSFGPPDREQKVAQALERIRAIGEKAQKERPDNSRLRGANVQSSGNPTVSDLDGRCKWLVGTLHLMVRKMYDAPDPEDWNKKFKDIEDKVEGLLKEVKALPDEMVQWPYASVPPPPPPPPPGMRPYGDAPWLSCQRPQGYDRPASSSTAGTFLPLPADSKGAQQSSDLKDSWVQHAWLQGRMKKLEDRAWEDVEESVTSEQEVRTVKSAIRSLLAHLPEKIDTDKQQPLIKCKTLWELQEALEREVEALKDNLLKLGEGEDEDE